jgi:hypothetical protein
MINLNELFSVEIGNEKGTLDTYVGVKEPTKDNSETVKIVRLTGKSIEQMLTIEYVQHDPSANIKVTGSHPMSYAFEAMPIIDYSFILNPSGELSSIGHGLLKEQAGAQLAASLIEKVLPEYVSNVTKFRCPDIGFKEVAEKIKKAGNPFYEIDPSKITYREEKEFPLMMNRFSYDLNNFVLRNDGPINH